MTAGDAEREAVLKSYLLGALPAAEQEEIDERFLADDDLHAELLATADDLIHAYLTGGLAPPDRERFESHFLASPRRRDRVAFVRSLLSAIDRVQDGGAGRTQAGADGKLPRPSRWVQVLPWAAVLVVGLAAGGWSIGERRRHERTLAGVQEREASLRQALLARDERVRDLEARLRVGSASADIATWALRAGVERGTTAADGFKVGGDWVRLRVLLEHDLHVTSYRASLQTGEGREILRVGGLREASGPEGRTVDVIVPAGLLPAGTYLLSIQRDAAGAPEELTATTFLVR